MRREKITRQTVMDCDGCGYIIGMTKAEWDAGENLEHRITTLSIPWVPRVTVEGDPNMFVEFHFHAPVTDDYTRTDCFRYWAHDTRIMRESLVAREFTDAEIDDFMAIHLYRDGDKLWTPRAKKPIAEQARDPEWDPLIVKHV